eukprot:CAMPEP_0183353608 /NCGR_PEP_ID=MMETSP0164_2-20130417/33996_1 /TAXON_ID=221442 /ORGANISM="Coccolithus pelagicus ssp braarudi, Strain PLY182g" /LENGTH=46 /DNA_ID= /DNA_START= /DNA_END= /DNA_ORIENTATION=
MTQETCLPFYLHPLDEGVTRCVDAVRDARACTLKSNAKFFVLCPFI